MDPVIYFLAEHYPWWGIPCVLIFGEATNHFRRNGMRGKMAVCAILSLMFLGLTVAYFAIGYEKIRPTLQEIETPKKF